MESLISRFHHKLAAVSRSREKILTTSEVSDRLRSLLIKLKLEIKTSECFMSHTPSGVHPGSYLNSPELTPAPLCLSILTTPAKYGVGLICQPIGQPVALCNVNYGNTTYELI